MNFWWLLPKQTMRSEPWSEPCTLWSLGGRGEAPLWLLLGDKNNSKVSFSRPRFTTQLLFLQFHNAGGWQLASKEQPEQTNANLSKWAEGRWGSETGCLVSSDVGQTEGLRTQQT